MECLSCKGPTDNKKYCSQKCKQKYYYYNMDGKRDRILKYKKIKYILEKTQKEGI